MLGGGGQSRLNPLQGSSNSAGIVGGNGSQQNKLRPASAKTGGLEHHYAMGWPQ